MLFRSADGGPWSRICGLPALWAGILYDKDALSAAWDLCKHWTAEEHNHLRRDAAKIGLKGTIHGRPVREVAEELLDIARHGLRRRARFSGGMVDETGYLSELEEIAESGLTPADRLLEAYHGRWRGDLSKLFDEQAY